MEWLEIGIAGNPAGSWLLALGIVAATLALAGLLRFALRIRLRRAPDTEGDFDDFRLDLLSRTRLILLASLVMHGVFRALLLTPQSEEDFGMRTLRRSWAPAR